MLHADGGEGGERAALELYDDRLSSGRGRDCARAALDAAGVAPPPPPPFAEGGAASGPIDIRGGTGSAGAARSILLSLPSVAEAQ